MGRVIDGTEAFALRRLVADGRRSINDLPTDGVDNVESIYEDEVEDDIAIGE